MSTCIYFLLLVVNSLTATPEKDIPFILDGASTFAVNNPSVDAGEDVVICNPGETVTLTATTSAIEGDVTLMK